MTLLERVLQVIVNDGERPWCQENEAGRGLLMTLLERVLQVIVNDGERPRWQENEAL